MGSGKRGNVVCFVVLLALFRDLRVALGACCFVREAIGTKKLVVWNSVRGTSYDCVLPASVCFGVKLLY